jgi:hypothetical protein
VANDGKVARNSHYIAGRTTVRFRRIVLRLRTAALLAQSVVAAVVARFSSVGSILI